MRDEILRKIGQIEQEEDEFNLYIRNLRNEEKCEEQCVYQDNQSLEYRFEECQKGDIELLNLLEQEREILQDIQRTRDDLMCCLDEMQKAVKYQCESEVDELRRQLRNLEV